MNWTVSRRIALGFTIILVLLATVGGIGWSALRRTTTAYEQALNARRYRVIPAYRGESDMRAANSSYLRFLLQPAAEHRRSRDSLLQSADSALRLLQDSAKAVSIRQHWATTASLMAQWKVACMR